MRTSSLEDEGEEVYVDIRTYPNFLIWVYGSKEQVTADEALHDEEVKALYTGVSQKQKRRRLKRKMLRGLEEFLLEVGLFR